MLTVRRFVCLLILGLLAGVWSVYAGTGCVVLLGDSNTWLGGDNCDNDNAWSFWFKKMSSPDICRSFARSGATWTHTSVTSPDTEEYSEVITDNNVISNQLLRLKKAVKEGRCPPPDLIIISAGTNDAWFADKRPEAFTELNGYTSLAGSIKGNCNYIKENFPEAKIALLTPPYSTKIDDTIINRTAEIIEKAGKDSGAVVIRLDVKECIDSDVERDRFRMTTDGVHTSRAGARKIGLRVASEMESDLIK